MKIHIRVCLSALAVLFALTVPLAGIAQETTSAIRVSLFGPDANPLAGVDVTVTDTRTGSVRTGESNDSGVVFLRGLPVGGPYTVMAVSDNFADQSIEDINNLQTAAAAVYVDPAVQDYAIRLVLDGLELLFVETPWMVIASFIILLTWLTAGSTERGSSWRMPSTNLSQSLSR